MLTSHTAPDHVQGLPWIETIAILADHELVTYFAYRDSVVYPDLPEANEAQLNSAKDILRNRFCYTGETFQLDPDFSWKPNPSHDKEWQIAFHKHYFLIDLIQAYRHSGEVVYLEKWRQLIESWIAEMGSGYITLSDAQVEAKRVESWCIAFMLLNSTDWHRHISGSFIRRFFTRVADETLYICQHLKPVRNHRTFQVYSIYLVGVLFPELSLHSYFLDIGTTLLSENLLTDFQQDGVHIEMSSHYHQLVAETGIRMLELAILNKITLSDALVKRLHKAVRFSLYLQWPNGDIPLINDSDNGNHLDLLRLGSRYFNDPELLWGASLGKLGQPPKNASVCFRESGYFILGDDWGVDTISYTQRQHVFFDCGKLGEGSHSHYDLFNFCYYVGGKPGIIDPGRYTYSGEPDAEGTIWRHYFKSTAAHNTVTIDRQDQTRYLNRTKHGPEVLLEERNYHLGRSVDWITARAASHNYSPRHERLFVYMGHAYLFIWDRLLSDDAVDHHYELNFHLPAQTDAVIKSKTGHLQLITDQCEIRSLINGDITGAIKPGWVSHYYGVKQQAPILSITQTGIGNKTFASIVAPLGTGKFAVESFQMLTKSNGPSHFAVELTINGENYRDQFIIHDDAADLFENQELSFQGKFLACRSGKESGMLYASAQSARSLVLSGNSVHQHSNGVDVEWTR